MKEVKNQKKIPLAVSRDFPAYLQVADERTGRTSTFFSLVYTPDRNEVINLEPQERGGCKSWNDYQWDCFIVRVNSGGGVERGPDCHSSIPDALRRALGSVAVLERIDVLYKVERLTYASDASWTVVRVIFSTGSLIRDDPMAYCKALCHKVKEKMQQFTT